MWIRRIARHAAAFLLTTLIAGLLGATLVRFGPGFETDEEQLDPRLNAQSVQALHASHASERNVLAFYIHYLGHMATGDLGVSRSLARPVVNLLCERAGVTLRIDWRRNRRRLASRPGAGAARRLVPRSHLRPGVHRHQRRVPVRAHRSSGALALFREWTRSRLPSLCSFFPKCFGTRATCWRMPTISRTCLAARARGLSARRIFFRHVTPWAAPQLLALAGVSLASGVWRRHPHRSALRSSRPGTARVEGGLGARSASCSSASRF